MNARRIVDFSLQNQRTIISIWVLLLALAGWGTTKLSVSSDNRVFYSDENSSFGQLKEFENKYLPNHNVSFLLSSRNGSSTFSELVRATSWLTKESWGVENVIRVDSIDTYPTAAGADSESFELSTISELICAAGPQCENTGYLLSPPPGIDRRLISTDRTSLAVSLALELDSSDTQQISRIVEDIKTLVDRFSATYPNINITHTGGIPMMHAFSIAANQDSARLAPITLLVILGLVSLLTGSFRAGLVLMCAGASSALLTLGLAGHLGHIINPATSVASILILTLVVTSAMHFVSSYLNDSRLYDSYRATINATKVNLRPIALATITSIVGFISLTFADAPPVGELGAMASLGILLGALHVFLLGPIFTQFLPTQSAPSISQRVSLRASKVRMSPLASALLILVLALLCLGTMKLSINDDFVKYFDEGFEFRKETDFISENLSGPNHLEIDVRSDPGSTIFTNSYLDLVARLSTFLRNKEEIASVFSVVDIFAEIEPLFEISQFEATDEELAQFYLAFELSLREGQSTTDYISNDQTSSRVSVILGDSDSTSIRMLIESIQAWSKENTDLSIVVTGENAPVAYLTPSNFRSMSFGIFGTLILAALAVAFVLRSLKLAAVCVFCTAAPIAIGFGIWGWTLGEIGLASVVVLAITIGIVIDDAIHIITRYQEIRSNEPQYSSPIEQTIRIAGGAIVSSSIALATGFGILAFSGFGVNAAMGLCTAMIVLSALVVDLLILPWLLHSRAKNGLSTGLQ